MTSRRPTGAALLRAAALTLALSVALVVAFQWQDVRAWFEGAGAWGPLAFAGLATLLMIGCFPVSALGITAGVLYGPWLGLAIMFPAGYVAGTAMFALGRGSLRGFVAGLVARDRRLVILEGLAAEKELRFNLLARLSPFNYGLVCYTLAAGRTRWRAYLLGMFAALPSMAAQVWAGALARRTRDALVAGERANPWGTAAAIFGAVALLVLVWQSGRLVRQAWQRAAAEGDNQTREPGSGSDHDAQ